MSPSLRPHQEKAVNELDNGKILCGGVGVGKTRTSLAYYVKRESPKDIYVITTAKKRDSLDWLEEAAKFGIGTGKDSTLHGVIIIDSWHNISKYEDLSDAFFIFDEQRLVGSGAWTKSFLKIAKNNTWILLSATPGDTWLDYIPVFVANGFYKNRTEFKRSHVIYNTFSKFPKVDHYVGVGTLVRLRNKITVQMPYERHTTRRYVDIPCTFDKSLFDKATIGRWHVFEHRPLRDVAELFLVMRKIVNSDPSRLDAVRSLMKDHPKLIIFYNFDYELEMLRTLAEDGCDSPSDLYGSNEKWHKTKHKTKKAIGSLTTTESHGSFEEDNGSRSTKNTTSLTVAEWNGHKHQPIPNTDRWVYLVQYVAGAEAWDCTETDSMVFYSLTYSYKNFIQAQGRIDRLNTPFTTLYYFMLVSNSLIDRLILKSLGNKESFQESKYVPEIWAKNGSEKSV